MVKTTCRWASVSLLFEWQDGKNPRLRQENIINFSTSEKTLIPVSKSTKELFPIFISDLTYMHYDTFLLKLRNKFSFIPHGIGTVQFLRDTDGKVVEMKVDIPNHDFFFTELEFKKK